MSRTNTKATHCKRGHEFTKGNTRKTVVGSRFCRICDFDRGTRAANKSAPPDDAPKLSDFILVPS